MGFSGFGPPKARAFSLEDIMSEAQKTAKERNATRNAELENQTERDRLEAEKKDNETLDKTPGE